MISLESIVSRSSGRLERLLFAHCYSRPENEGRNTAASAACFRLRPLSCLRRSGYSRYADPVCRSHRRFFVLGSPRRVHIPFASLSSLCHSYPTIDTKAANNRFNIIHSVYHLGLGTWSKGVVVARMCTGDLMFYTSRDLQVRSFILGRTRQERKHCHHREDGR